MSWSGYTHSDGVNKKEFKRKLDFISQQTQPEGCESAANDQLEAALDAVELLMQAVGTDDSIVFISIGGHANPQHARLQGWGDEFITVSVQFIQ